MDNNKLLEAIRENTAQVRKLNELLAPELRKTETLRRIRQEKAEQRQSAIDCIRDWKKLRQEQSSSSEQL